MLNEKDLINNYLKGQTIRTFSLFYNAYLIRDCLTYFPFLWWLIKLNLQRILFLSSITLFKASAAFSKWCWYLKLTNSSSRFGTLNSSLHLKYLYISSYFIYNDFGSIPNFIQAILNLGDSKSNFIIVILLGFFIGLSLLFIGISTSSLSLMCRKL